MIALSIFPRAEGMVGPEDRDRIVEVQGEMKMGCLAAGTVDGNPTVSMFFELPDGRLAFVQTTLRLFLSAADAFKAVHGDPRT